MKKRLLLGAMLMGAFAVNAQIADGSPAPELSGNRIISVNNTTNEVNYGEAISLQAYLDAGKTVVVDGSATWCGPCWSFHNSKTLDNLYTAYGPEASDELRVIFVEADPSTAVSELGGVNQAPVAPYTQERGNPQGNWLEGVPYPVINSDIMVNSAANGGYGLEAFPSVYVIVPSGTVGQPGTVYNLERDTMANMVAAINEARGTDLVGVDNWGKIESAPYRYCDAIVPVTAFVQGFGHTVTSAQVQLKKDGVVVATETFNNLDLEAFEYAEVTFTDVNAEAGAVYQAELLQINDGNVLTTIPENNISGEYAVTPSASVESSANVTVVLHTDEYPAEMKLYITSYDEEGALIGVWNTPTYTNTATYKEKTLTYNIDFTSITGVTTDTCLGVYMADQYGDGWDYNGSGAAVEHGVTITSGDGTVLFQHNGTFVGAVQQDATFRQNGVLANDKFETSNFAVYPNPSNGIFNFSTEEAIDVTVTDLTGKTVHTAKGIENGGSINLSGLSTGMYIAKINGASGERVEKLIIK